MICVLVAAMVLVGGATRLTESGLSITEWDLAKQLVPPLTEARWLEEFDLYRRTTEYQVVNAGMSLQDFQFIYWWEWGHRFLGKVIGVAFALPFLAFWATGRLRGRFWSCLALFALGGLQGAIGWWMVTSGLFQATDVSNVRLAVHLGMAFIILAFALTLAVHALRGPAEAVKPAPWRPVMLVFLAVLFCQIILGALLAGANAGGAYTDWPTIGGEWFPTTYAELSPLASNLWHNPAMMQFNHRTLGYMVAVAAVLLGLWVAVREQGAARAMGLALALFAVAQAALGIATIVSGSPIDLSLIHQGGALALWIMGVALTAAGEGREPVTASEAILNQRVARSA
jgi:cytochrome c oxidase assembly protein subunit 15